MEYNQHINRVELQGIVGTSRVSNLGEKNAVSFSLATNYAFKDREGCHAIETPGITVPSLRTKRTTCQYMPRERHFLLRDD